MSRDRFLMALGLVLLALAVAWSARPHDETPAERVDRISAELRCVTCQGLSIKDSPAESARQMRDVVAERVAEGRTDAQIRDEFRGSYGDWVLLSPPLLAWTGLVWVAPLGMLALGLWFAARRVGPPREPATAATPSEVAALRERVAREEALEG